MRPFHPLKAASVIENPHSKKTHAMKISHLMFVGIALVVLGDTFLTMYNRNQEDDWPAFRDLHHCTPVAKTDGSNRAGYRCDDGQVHYRWRQMR